MTWRKKLMLLLALCLMVGAVVRLYCGDRAKEPIYEGRLLSDWLREYVYPQDPRFKPKAAAAVRQVGTNAIPILINWLLYDEPLWKQKLRPVYLAAPRWIHESEWLGAKIIAEDGPKELCALWASTGFRLLGAKATNAIPVLQAALEKARPGRTRERIHFALENISDDILREKLMAAVRDREKNHVTTVANLTEGARTNSASVLMSLAQLTGDDDPGIAALSCELLGELGLDPRASVLSLSEALEASDARILIASIVALTRFDPAVCLYPDKLKNLLADQQPSVREAATNALKLVAPELLTNSPAQ